MFRKLIHRTAYAALIVLWGAALAAPSWAGQIAEIGTILADGTIQIDESRFQPAFEDGVAVHEIELDESSGVILVFRWAEDGCNGESFPLRDSSRNLIPPGGQPNPPPGSVWVQEDEVLKVRCVELGNRCSRNWFLGQQAGCRRAGTRPCVCIAQKSDMIAEYGTEGCILSSRIPPETWSFDASVRPEFIEW